MTARCVVNLVHLDPPANGGVSRVAREVSRLLAEEAEPVFAVGWRFAEEFVAWAGIEDAVVVPCVPGKRLPAVLAATRPAAVVSPLFGGDPLDREPALRRVPHLVLVPDALSLDHPELFEPADRAYRAGVYQGARGASRIVTLSEHARSRLVHYLGVLPERVAVVPLGVDPSLTAEQQPVEVPKPFLLYPANDWPHKRHDLLMASMRQVWQARPDLHLVLTGSHKSRFREALIDAGGSAAYGRVHDVGFVTDAQLSWLYTQAEALVFVSAYEGFGMPVLEAMASGCVVVCAERTSLPEVAGDAAVLVGSDDPSDWANALLHELPRRRTELRARGIARAADFGWERVRSGWMAELAAIGLAREARAAHPGEVVVSLRAVSRDLLRWSSAALDSERSPPTADRHFVSSLRAGAKLIRRRHLDRLAGFARPKLGWLRQYPARPLEIPARYRERQALETAPTISIVTPSFNQAEFLERTIRSVLDQDYPALEYFVEDGASTDDSADVGARFGDRIHWHSAPDDGQAQAINRGFGRTSGEILAYLNSDDLLLPGTLHYVAAYFASHPRADVVYGHRVLIDHADGEIGRWILPRHSPGAFKWKDFVPQETMFWRRSAWERAGARIDEGLQFAIDWDLLFRFMAANARFARLPRFLAAFRVHDRQKTSSEMGSLGRTEINVILKRYHGREIGDEEIDRRTRAYLARHVVHHNLFRLGLLKY